MHLNTAGLRFRVCVGEQQRFVEGSSEDLFTFHFLCTSMAARIRLRLCARPPSAPGLSLWLQQVSAMQMQERSCFVKISSIKPKPCVHFNTVQ